jgi:hypothetical protein
MASDDFKVWLDGLRRAGQLIEYILPAYRELKWEEVIQLGGDWTGAAMEGSVRALPGAGSPLVEFSFSGPVVATVEGETTSTWLVWLAAGSGANSTGVLPLGAAGNGVTEFPYMFRITPSGGDEAVLRGGIFTLIEQA